MARPSGGQARVFGLAADAPDASVEIRRRTGFVSDEKDLYGYMSVAEMIRFTAAFFPKWRADLEQRYLKSFELPPQRSVSSSRAACAPSWRCCWRSAAARSC
jgi:ABC-2 type transport system ATP-binding protein